MRSNNVIAVVLILFLFLLAFAAFCAYYFRNVLGSALRSSSDTKASVDPEKAAPPPSEHGSAL